MVTITPTTLTTHVGYQYLMTAECSLSGTISWSSLDETRATVVGGLVTFIKLKATARFHVVTIRATSSAGGSADCVCTIWGIGVGFVGKMIGVSSVWLSLPKQTHLM